MGKLILDKIFPSAIHIFSPHPELLDSYWLFAGHILYCRLHITVHKVAGESSESISHTIRIVKPVRQSAMRVLDALGESAAMKVVCPWLCIFMKKDAWLCQHHRIRNAVFCTVLLLSKLMVEEEKYNGLDITRARTLKACSKEN
jgi:hypothetical protein